MKVFRLLFLLFTAIVGLFVLIAVGINATDEELLPETRQGQLGFPAQEGFPLPKLFVPVKDRPETLKFNSHGDYLKNPSEFDQRLAQKPEQVSTLIEAFRQGQVHVKEQMTLAEGIQVYPFYNHGYFLAHLSRLLQSGQAGEALDLLQKSNLFLKSIVLSPGTMISTMIALNELKNNAIYLVSLKEAGVLNTFSESMKASLRIEKDSEEIFKSTMRRELQIGLNIIMAAKTDPSTLVGTNSGEPKELVEKFSHEGFVANLLYRPNQTANWFTKIHEELAEPGCANVEASSCSKTLRDEVMVNMVTYNLVNPTGRRLIGPFIPFRSREHLKTKVESLNAFTAGL